MADFVMPSLGADMTEGTVLEWLVKPGETVHKGDIVAVVDTAKAAVEVEVFTEGVVEELLVPVGTKVPVGALLARIGDGSAVVTDPVETEAPTTSTPVQGASVPSPPASAPLVRRVATDLGVDLATVTGTGPHGRITRADVVRSAGGRRDVDLQLTPQARRLAAELGVDLADLAEMVRSGVLVPARSDGVVGADDVRSTAAAAPAPATSAPSPAPASQPSEAQPGREGHEAQPTAGGTGSRAASPEMRRAIARLMARSKREIPHYYLTTTVDLAQAVTWMTARNRELAVSGRLVPAALILKATALALHRHPELNGYWIDDAFVPGPGIHLGVAVSLRGGGLVAPAIHDADALSLDELMAAIRDLVGRARAGRLRGSEMTDGTATVTNLGDQGVEAVHGVIYPPQVALVGVGRVIERPVAVEGMLTVHPVSVLTLAADHRATDGFSGSRLLTTIDDLLQTPEEL